MKPTDTIDAEHIDQTVSTKGYKLLTEYIGSLASSTARTLTAKETGWEETMYLRGYLAALKDVMAAPDALRRQALERDRQRERQAYQRVSDDGSFR